MNMEPPTMQELDRVIETLKKNLATWKGNADYARHIEVELFCVMAYTVTSFMTPPAAAPSGCGENGCSFPKCDCD